MLFWTKLLTIAHAATSSVHPYLCLYYIHMLKFDISTISVLLASVMIIRIPASIFWIDLVDHRPSLHGIFTGLLTAIGTAGILMILSVPPIWSSIALPIAILTSIFDGLFYQPLEPLIDSAIIKILGDYKILYDMERQYGKWASALMTLGIGWSLDDDHDFDTLMVTILIGSVILFLLSLSTSVQAADPSLLGIVCNEVVDETSPLSKQNLQSADTSGSFMYYKPYSLFGEQLSHISEEDASMLQRMATTNNSVSIRPLPRHASICSGSSYTSNHHHHHHHHHVVAEYEDSACFYQHPFYPHAAVAYTNHPHAFFYLENNSPPSFELARLPYPPPLSPVIVLITLVPGCYQNLQSHDEEHTYPPTSYPSTWIVKSFICSMFSLGLVFGMTQTLLFPYLHDILEFPMHMIGMIGLIMIFADLLASRLVIRIIHQFQLSVIIGGAHSILALCAFTYMWLQPGLISTKLIAILLQSLQSIAFSIVWLLAAHQVDSVILTDKKRMILKGVMATLYSSVGPAIGTLLVGYLVKEGLTFESYSQVYQYASGLAVISAILSWEWSTTDY